jgi:hypothetical protein
MTEAIWCVAYGLLWWWVALMLPSWDRQQRQRTRSVVSRHLKQGAGLFRTRRHDTQGAPRASRSSSREREAAPARPRI